MKSQVSGMDEMTLIFCKINYDEDTVRIHYSMS